MKANTLMIAKPQTNSNILTCRFCGHTGTDVHQNHYYIIGYGKVSINECKNEADCKARMENLFK